MPNQRCVSFATQALPAFDVAEPVVSEHSDREEDY